MIVKILNSSSKAFNGVRYNDKKIDNGTGELMTMKNFPSFINEESSQEEVRDYLKSISESKKVKKPQFHATISTKYQEHTKEELTDIAESFMKEMGYGEQPYIVVFHNDTENNHIHIVSTRVDKSTGKKIDDSFEKLKSQKALAKVLEERNPEESYRKNLEKLLQYQYSTFNQLSALLERNGFKVVPNKQNENVFDVLKNGVRQMSLDGTTLSYQNTSDKGRKKQLKAILSKYKEIYSNKVFKVIDDREQKGQIEERDSPKIKLEFESELQDKLRTMFGIDIFFHHKDEGQTPFGYTLIDNKTKAIFKGSEILKMKELFDITDDVIDKKTYESIKDYYISDEKVKKVLLEELNKEYDREYSIKDFMLSINKQMKPKEIFKANQNETLAFIKNKNIGNDHIRIVEKDGQHYSIHSKYHQVMELDKLIGEKAYEDFLNPKENVNPTNNESINPNTIAKEVATGISDVLGEILKPHYTAKDPAEEEMKKRRKRKKR